MSNIDLTSRFTQSPPFSGGDVFINWSSDDSDFLFASAGSTLTQGITSAAADYQRDPSDPKKLAAYQAALETYQMYAIR